MYAYFTSKKYKRFGFKNRNYFIKLHIRQSRKFHYTIQKLIQIMIQNRIETVTSTRLFLNIPGVAVNQ